MSVMCILLLFVNTATEYGLVLVRIIASEDSPIQYRQVHTMNPFTCMH